MTVSFFDEEAPNFALNRGSWTWNPEELGRKTRDTSKRILARCTDLIEVSKDHKVNFLHSTVRDFLQLRDVQDLVQRAGANFDAHQYMCNATLSQLLIPTKIGYIDPQRLYKLTPLIEKFIDHAYEMELHRNFTPIELLGRLDEEVGRLKEEDPRFRSTGPYQKNWLVEVAVQRGLYGYLCQKIHHVRALIHRKDDSTRPLLDIALRPMQDPLSQENYFVSHDLRVISLLLENGANPNERCKGAPIWQNFLDEQCGPSGPKKVKITEMLLMHGAAFNVWDKNGHIKNEYCSVFTDEEAIYLNDVRLEFFKKRGGKRQRSLSTASQDHPLKRRSSAAVRTPNSRPDCESTDNLVMTIR